MVATMAETTSLYPDVIPREVKITPVIENNSGWIVDHLG